MNERIGHKHLLQGTSRSKRGDDVTSGNVGSLCDSVDQRAIHPQWRPLSERRCVRSPTIGFRPDIEGILYVSEEHLFLFGVTFCEGRTIEVAKIIKAVGTHLVHSYNAAGPDSQFKEGRSTFLWRCPATL